MLVRDLPIRADLRRLAAGALLAALTLSPSVTFAETRP